MMQMEDDEIEAEAADGEEDSSGPRNDVITWFEITPYLFISRNIVFISFNREKGRDILGSRKDRHLAYRFDHYLTFL